MSDESHTASCTSRSAGDVLLVVLSGRIAGAAGAALLDWLPVSRGAALPHVVVNLSGVLSIDRAGADGLVDACLATALRRGTLALTAPTAAVYHSLWRFGVLRTVEVFTDDEVAVDAVTARPAPRAPDPRHDDSAHAASEGAILSQEMLADLRRLIEALDRRVPRLERLGEAAIASDAAGLRERALRRILEIEHETPQ